MICTVDVAASESGGEAGSVVGSMSQLKRRKPDAATEKPGMTPVTAVT